MFYGRNPATGQELAPALHAASPEDLERAAQLASAAAAPCARIGGRARGAFLRRVAERLEAMQAELVERAVQETALAKARIEGELGRTCFQWRFFAALVEEGSWVDARLDQARDAAGAPVGPAIRSLLAPLGPVAVFDASNFPLAFSVAGGDTAAALAAGNPVIVKAHPAHPGASELAAQAVAAAVRDAGMPAGAFSLLFDAGIEVGTALVMHPALRAVGFTGSQRAGRHLMDVAAARPQPIPVYAEMGSLNPVFILPRALAERGAEIAAALHQSVTQSAGQFCTKPGVVVVGEGADGWVAQLASTLAAAPAFTLLSDGIAAQYRSGAEARSGLGAVQTLVAPGSGPGEGAAGAAALFQTGAAAFLAAPELAEELFGPSTLLVRPQTPAELMAVARSLSGHLTATVFATGAEWLATFRLVAPAATPALRAGGPGAGRLRAGFDWRRTSGTAARCPALLVASPSCLRLLEYDELLPLLASRVGRVVVNGVPTGVAVCDAMVHGGPYPATSDGRSSSVGAQAMLRFVRPVCYQGVPDYALPAELQDANPLRIWRRLDGQLTAP